MQDLITGIQQCGIGTNNAHEAALYYKDLFGLDALVFDDTAEASLMKAYTGNRIYKRRALLTMNMQGGGGFELWQFINREATAAATPIRFGDIGIFAIKIKCPDVVAAFRYFLAKEMVSVSPLQTNAAGEYHFWLTDKYGHVFNMVKANELFSDNHKICAGVCGAVIGVSNMQQSLHFYKEFLGIENERYNIHQTDIGPVSYSAEDFHCVLLQKNAAVSGPFSCLLGDIQIELVQAKNYKGNKIYTNRFWGDLGFIHLCFDVLDLCSLKTKATDLQYSFTVDSKSSFVMERAGGRFCYVEDPDNTLIELVETYTVPILKKAGWYLNLKKRKHQKPLPAWMIKTMGLTKVK
ncbi:MAG: VOC family protein [Gloeobacteraceae cyanobacterium ES-bin-316]|nr:VOC family protein [Ferruginibacter sp.]